MPRNITVTFADGSTHVYRNAPDDITPEQATQRAQKDFGKSVKALDGGRKQNQKTKRAYGTTDDLASRVSFGLSDKVGAAAEAVGGEVRELFGGRKAPIAERYRSASERNKESQEEWRRANPGKASLNSVLGFFGGAAPVKTAGTLRQIALGGAATGAAAAAGEKDTTLADVIGGTAAGAVMAPALAVAAPYAVRGGRAVIKKMTPSRNTIREAAERLNIPMTPSTSGGVGRVVQEGLAVLPGGAQAVSKGAAAEVGALAEAARQTAAKIGPVSNPEGAGNAVSRGAAAFRRATATRGNALYGIRDDMMRDVPILMDGTRSHLAQIESAYPNQEVRDLVQRPVVRRILDAADDAGQLTVGEAVDLLSSVRTLSRNAKDPVLRRQLGMARSAIEGDIYRAAQAADAIAGRTGGGAVEAQRNADRFWAGKRQLETGALKAPLASADDEVLKSGESIFTGLMKDAQREGGNAARFNATFDNIPKVSRREFSATAFDHLGRAKAGAQNAAQDAWSADTFMTNWSKLSDPAKARMFGGANVAQDINAIVTYADRLKQVGRVRNFSNTARNTIGAAWLGAIGLQAAEGDVEGATKTAAMGGAAYGAGRLLMEMPAFRQWMRSSLGRVASKPNPQTVQENVKRLSTLAARHPELVPYQQQLVQRLELAISPSPASRVAADEGEPVGGEPPRQ